MNWGRVFFVFFSVMGLTLGVEFLFEGNIVILFLCASVNFLCATFRIGIKSSLSAEILATFVVAIFHLAAAFVILQVFGMKHLGYGIVIGAVVANFYALVLLTIESIKDGREEI